MAQGRSSRVDLVDEVLAEQCAAEASAAGGDHGLNAEALAERVECVRQSHPSPSDHEVGDASLPQQGEVFGGRGQGRSG